MADRNLNLLAVLKHKIPEVLTDGDFKAKCNYCNKEFAGSINATSN